MNEILLLILSNLEKVGFGVLLFLGAYLVNIIFGVWRNVKIEGYDFDLKLIINSAFKFLVLGIGIALLTIIISLIPLYATYVGIEIESEMVQMMDSLVIIGAFFTATLRYIVDAVNKIKDIVG